jgi:FdhD protein
VGDSRLRVPVRRAAGGPTDDADWVAVEEPLEIRVGGESLVITMRTPGHDADLACGFLFTEGLIAEPADVTGVSAEGNVVSVGLRSEPGEQLGRLRRNFYTSSSCGICGKTSLEALRARARLEVRGEDLRVNPAALAGLPQALARCQPTFASTGGLHAAALFGADGEILDVREDVGRHNAVDKLIGAALRAGRLPFWNLGILVSGRASFEIVEKARMAGCPLVVAVGAPSSLAIDAAWESGITLVGFLRDGRFNVYTVPARVGNGA